jgi:hypothetical protein
MLGYLQCVWAWAFKNENISGHQWLHWALKARQYMLKIIIIFFAGVTDIEVICCLILPHIFAFYFFYYWQQLTLTVKFFRLPDA